MAKSASKMEKAFLCFTISFIGIAINNKSVSGIECYNFSCWGTECNRFPMTRPHLIVDCPIEAEGCLHSRGFVNHNADRSKIDDPQRTPPILPFLRETRSCWIPRSLGFKAPVRGAGDCYMTTMTHWFPPYQMVPVTSMECLCEKDLCNGDREPSAASSIMVTLMLLLIPSLGKIIL